MTGYEIDPFGKHIFLSGGRKISIVNKSAALADLFFCKELTDHHFFVTKTKREIFVINLADKLHFTGIIHAYKKMLFKVAALAGLLALTGCASKLAQPEQYSGFF